MSETLAEKVRRRVRALRLELGWTQEELAEKAGLLSTEICRFEVRARPQDIRLSRLERLAKALKVSPSELVK